MGIIQKIWNKEWLLLLLLWVFLTLFNINKAFHIDDTFHIESAIQLLEDPIHPMSAKVNWSDTYHYLSESNHPPLFYYLIAIVGGIFSFSEIPLHLLLSIFTYLTLYYFVRIAKLVSPQLWKVLLLLFAFSSPLVINQNLMLDVPLLACILAATLYLLKGTESKNIKDYLIASTFFTVGMMMKYSILPILPLMLIIILLHKQYKMLLTLFVPILVVGIWSIWNYWEYGSTQLFDRSTHQVDFNLTANFLACTGAVSTFLLSLSQGLFVKYKKAIFMGIAGMFFLLFAWGNEGSSALSFLNIGFMRIFPLIGGLLYLILLIHAIQLAKQKGNNFLLSNQFTILLALLGFSFFFILFPQFMASRHLLVVVPFILLYGAPLIERAGKRINSISIVFSLALMVLLGVSDWFSADFYRKMATEAMNETKGTTWSLGHWGWQWYSKKEGMKFFDSKNELALQKGDYVVYPANVPKQPMSENIKLITIKKIVPTSDLSTFFSGKDRTSFYNSSVDKPLWNLSMSPIDTIYICQVQDAISLEDLIFKMRNNASWLASVTKKAEENNVSLDSMLLLDAQWMKKQALKEFDL